MEWSDFFEEMTAGDDMDFKFAVTRRNSDGQDIPENITDYLELWFTAKRKPLDADNLSVMLLTKTNGGITIIDGPNGVARVNIVPSNTSTLTQMRTYDLYAEIQTKDAAGKIDTLAQGRLRVKPQLTIATSAVV